MSTLPPPLAAVVIPCYNKAGTVARAIESVKRQTITNLECVIVDDGSTDDSRDVVEAAIADDRRFRYRYQENQGVAAARNRGVLTETSAPYVCCLDADDAIAPAFLETCIDALAEDPSLGIAYTGLYYYKPDGEEGLSQWPGEWDYAAFLRGQNQIPTCNVARREVWARLGGQRGRYCRRGAGEEDAEMWLRAGAYGWKAEKVTHEGLFRYSWQSGMVSGNPDHVPTDFRAWHPWTTDGKHPFASYAPPANGIAHPVRQYDEPVVSVVIPVGPGHEETLVNALDSLEAQTFRRWEAVVVWDSAAPVPGWIETAYPYVRWRHTDGAPKGAGAARNTGAVYARAPFLLFLDADDHLVPTALARMLETWRRHDRDGGAIITCDYVAHAEIDDPDNLAPDLRFEGYIAPNRSNVGIVRFRQRPYDCERAMRQPPDNGEEPYVIALISSLIPKAWHDEVGGFDESLDSWEDVDYWWRLAWTGKCFVRINEPLLVYRFPTGTRRAHGLQKYQGLLEYLRSSRKREREKRVGCNGCGNQPENIQKAFGAAQAMRDLMQRRAIQNEPAPVQQVNVQGRVEMTEDDMVRGRYNSPKQGDHRVIGPATGLDYGYRQGGGIYDWHEADVNHYEQRAQREHTDPLVVRVDAGPDGAAQTAPKAPKAMPRAPRTEAEEAEAQQAREAEIETANQKAQAVREQLVAATEAKQQAKTEAEPFQRFDFDAVQGLSGDVVDELRARGLMTPRSILKTGATGLKDVPGVGPATAKKLLAAAADQDEPSASPDDEVWFD